MIWGNVKSISFGIFLVVLSLGWWLGCILIVVVEVDISEVRCGVTLAQVLCIYFAVKVEGEYDIVMGGVVVWLVEGNLFKVRHDEHEKEKLSELNRVIAY